MGTRDLPDMYALSPRALGIHIRQITRAHVTTINKLLQNPLKYGFTGKEISDSVPKDCKILDNTGR